MSVNCKFVTGVEQAVTHKRSECVLGRGGGGYTGKVGGKRRGGKERSHFQV